MSLRRVPFVGLLLGFVALLMLIPSLQAASAGEWRVARGFLYPALFGIFVAGAVSVLLRPMKRRDTARHELATLLILWVVLSGYASLPLMLLTPWIGWTGAWFEMIAALTTTGGSVYTKASNAPDAIQLWRGLVGWTGGLLTLMAAYVIMAPRRLGGFEVFAAADGISDTPGFDLRVTAASLEDRALRALKTILPIYFLMTAFLGFVFNTADKPGLVAAVHAMSIVSTSGITPIDGGFSSSGNLGAEAVAVVFMVLAATRLAYPGASKIGRRTRLRHDPELKLMVILVGLATLLVFLRHWLGVLTISEVVEVSTIDGLRAVWGAFFTSVSFITTTGFESYAWTTSRQWAGLENPGLILLGLCIIGGGAATTAGGIKLIRAYALIRHGGRELERIAVPHSVAGQGSSGRGLRREGAFIAWAFMMLFIVALLAAVLGLTLSGMKFTDAFIGAIAALSNTGPAFTAITDHGLRFAILDDAQRVILAIAMVLGRVETLAVIALFNPDNWGPRGRGSKNTGKSLGQTPMSTW